MSKEAMKLALGKIEKAHEKVTALCSGTERWTMSVPVRADYDHDVVISAALTAASAVIREALTSVPDWASEAKEQPAQPTVPQDIPDLIAGALGVSRGTAYDMMREALAEQPAQQEPVAWLHTKIEGVVVPHRPADLGKHPDRWEALYKTPPPCPTCEALARTVMMDQTGRDA